MRHLLAPSLLVLAASACTPGVNVTKAPLKSTDKVPMMQFAATKAPDAARLNNALYLAPGAPVRGTLAAGDDRLRDGTFYDTYYYQARAGESVTIDMTSTDFDAMLLIDDVQNTRLAADDDGGDTGSDARVTYTFAREGTYLIRCNSYAEATGAYEVRLTSGQAAPRTASRPQMQAIAVGQRISGSLNNTTMSLGSMPVVVYQFDAEAGQAYTFRTSSNGWDPMLYVVRMDGDNVVPIAQDDDNGGRLDAMVVAEPTVSGRHAVIVTHTEGDPRRGDFTLSMTAGGLSMPFTAFSDTDWARRYPGGGDSKGKYAVLVGIADNPPGMRDLPTSLSDVDLMRRALVEKLGFDPKNIVVITDREATRENIMQAIARHLGQAGPQGTALFYYSGHGGQTDNALLADDEPDGKDETIAVYSRRGGTTEILDDEIGALADRLRAGNVTFILDSCHSGTATRDADETTNISKALTDEEQALVERPDAYLAGGSDLSVTEGDADPGSTINAAPTARHLLLSAAAASEVASSGGNWPDTAPSSVFTHFLYKAIMASTPATTLDRMMETVRNQVVAYGRAVPNRTVQTPQIEGRAGAQTLGRYFGIR